MNNCAKSSISLRTGIMPRALLIGETAQGASHLASGFQELELVCSWVSSYERARSCLSAKAFSIVLSPVRLCGASGLPLIDLLEGSRATLFYSYPVEHGCWWLPALRHGGRCFGSPALRSSELVSALEQLIADIPLDSHLLHSLRPIAPRSAQSVLPPACSRNEVSAPAANVSEDFETGDAYDLAAVR
jgi:hypothetical protein